MDTFLLIGLFILVFVGLPVGLGLIIYFVPRKLGYPKTSKYLTIVYSLFILIVILFSIFQDQLFTRNDARKLVEEQEILLSDKFELESNESMSAIGDYYHTFTLKISEQDKSINISQIRNSTNFKKLGEPTVNFQSVSIDRYYGPKQIQNYETESGYVREYFETNGQGYSPTFRRITIEKKGNTLIFEDIDE